jgi:uncharacterized cupredoxin-like copper-binding protein
MVCNISGHYKAGMHAPLTVSKAVSSTAVGATVKDFSIALDRTIAPEGAFQFSVTNTGPSVHELVIFRTDLAAHKLPQKNGAVDEEGAGVQHITEREDIKIGAPAGLEAVLVRGRCVFICNLPGHYQAGMRAAFTVT